MQPFTIVASNAHASRGSLPLLLPVGRSRITILSPLPRLHALNCAIRNRLLSQPRNRNINPPPPVLKYVLQSALANLISERSRGGSLHHSHAIDSSPSSSSSSSLPTTKLPRIP